MLFKNIKQFKSVFGGTLKSTDLDNTWQAYINEAVMFHIEPAVGAEILEELHAKVSATELLFVDGTTDLQKKLIGYLRVAIAAYADYVGTLRLLVITSDGGKTTSSPPNAQTPPKWSIMAGMEAAITRGNAALEKALAFLEKNKADFDTWADSDTYTENTTLLLYNSTKLTQYHPHTSQSRRMYLMLKPYLEKIQISLSKMLGTAFFETLKEANSTQISGGSVSEEMATVMDLCRVYITHKAIVDAVPYLNISEDWRLISMGDSIQSEATLGDARRTEIAAKNQTLAEGALKTLINYLQANASVTVFPLYFASDIYTANAANTQVGGFYKNDATAKFAIL